MKLLDLYIARELLGPFLFGLALFITVIVSGEYLFKLTSFIANGAPFMPVAELFGLRIIVVLVVSMPAAMLLAALLAFGRLSSESELVAIQASGVPLYRVAYMSVVMGLGLSLLAFVINEFVIPPATQQSHKLEEMVLVSIKNQVVKQAGAGKMFVVQDFEGGQIARVVLARNFDPTAGRLDDVTFIEFADGRPKMLVEAESAEWVKSNQWLFRNARFTAIGPVNRDKHMFVDNVPEATITLNKTPETVAKDIKDPDEMSYFDLRQYIRSAQARHVPARLIAKLNVALQTKLSLPFASLVFAVLGTPLGVRRQRSSAAMGVSLSIIILFAYYVLWHSMAILGENGQTSPVIAAWAANVVALVIGFGLILKTSR